MNASKRGPRLGGPHDFYETPAWCVERLLEMWDPGTGPGVFVDPCAGRGAIIRAASKVLGLGPEMWRAFEIREEEFFPGAPLLFSTPGAPLLLSARDCTNCDFLELGEESLDRGVCAVITNPPYSLAAEFVEKCRFLYPNASLVMLLRLAFLASEARLDFFARMGVPSVLVLPNRPSFTQETKCTDSADYGWFIWSPDECDLPRIGICNSTPVAVRRGGA